ncbi:acyl-CoA dehydrogenase family protein [Actinophytocola sp.]|uniref:acyl-CoA dehydrogenase family protein n=1 Tax=Actinophytocola sp. TaxID=1872138 RepID=UPI00389AB427
MTASVATTMDHLLTPAAAEHHARLCELVGDSWRGDAAAWDRAGRLPAEVLRWCAEQGLLGAPLPAEAGGGGWNMVRTGLLYEALGRVGASLASLVNVHGMAAQTIARWGSEEQHRTVLPDLATGRRIAAIAMTEPGAGSDLAGMTTTLDARDGGLVLNGTKVFITFGGQADVFLVFAYADGGDVACLVNRNTPGLTIEPMGDVLGLRAACLARLEFRGCRVDPAALVGRPGFGLAVLAPHALEHGRHAAAWMAAGMLHEVFAATARHALARHAFGRALIDHGQIQSIVTRMGTDLEAARHLCLAASEALDARDPAAGDRVLAAKYFACRVLADHAEAGVQVLASSGVLESSVTARTYRDAKVLNIIEGTTQVLERMLAPRLAASVGRDA